MRPSARTLGRVTLFALVCVAVYVLPAFVNDFRAQQFAYVGIYLIALIGLNILTGYTGQISLGHGAFMAIGGYTTAILVADHGVKDLYTIPLAALVAGGAGLLFGLPALRLSGLYLALATFSIAVAAPAVIKKFEGFTGGGQGINLFGLPDLTGGISDVHVFGQTLNFNNWLYYLSWTIALVSFAVGWLLLRGRVGRAFRAVRDSETAAASSGVNLALYKTVAFGISAAYAGVAGSLFAIATTFVNPDTFPIALSIFLLVGVVVGGLGALGGLVVGATFIYFMQISWAQQADKAIPDWLPFLGDLDTNTPGAPAVAFGVVLILVMMVVPTGASGLLRRVSALTSRIPGRS
jgi:branched-chain amino acid transport system permease protein